MKSELEVKFGSVIYDKINTVRMSELERQVAINAMHDADMIVEGVLWMTRKVKQLFSMLLLKPGVTH